MKIQDFDFPLPENLIALRPMEQRDHSRLLVLRRDGSMEHTKFAALHEYLNPGDMLLLNKTKVLPMRLLGRKPGGGVLEMLLVANVSGNRWEIMSRGRYSGPLEISPRLRAEIMRGEEAELFHEGALTDILWKEGVMPLPPYIKRPADGLDKERYQTVYAEDEGSIAAPTAGLHFTPDLLDDLENKGIVVRSLTLHVGRGTFIPVRAHAVENHTMEEERFEIAEALVEEIRHARGRIVAVGTTTTRALEAFALGRFSPHAADNGTLRGSTDIFLYPGHRFRTVGGLLTNFHLPRSTPLMLASAFAGRENLLRAYDVAIGKSYRFFTYGDAMLLL
jgi:S-adenosylmethionine:tRNA ribosyltransferase-isomerase